MRLILILFLLFSLPAFSQWKEFKISVKGDTINRVDHSGLKQGPWVIRYESVRGEPGYEEEGYFHNGRKEGEWRLFNLMGDLVGIENYRWGFKDGVCKYYSMQGELKLEQAWKALNPDKQYDTLQVESVDVLGSFREVIVKNEGASLRHGTWKYYDAAGLLLRSEQYTLGKLEGDQQAVAEPVEKKPVAKPKEVLEFEKKNSGKKKVRYKDGSTGGN